ncbi:DUF1559 domain-containing protein [Symmachiella dynata]|uniref:DUF1559 family PulG-like putative transporter n=1 Tax=Symmachiella dynata TaxID=2527995 RepID=UPI0018D31B06|nr:DUF1559 domain-containing protein [Symmachiella dynata]
MTGHPDDSPHKLTIVQSPFIKVVMTLVKLFAALCVGALVLGFLVDLAGEREREAARSTQCRNNLRQIGLALHKYHDDYGGFPPAYTVDANGKPLHSWRTLLLPYLDHKDVYNAIDLSKPWDDPVNAKANTAVVAVYLCPSDQEQKHRTPYLAVVTPVSCMRSTESRPLSEVTDGKPNPIMVIEVPVNSAVPWMSPQDADEQLVLNSNSRDDLHHAGGNYVLFVDASCHLMSSDTPATKLRSLISAAGDEIPEPGADTDVNQ